MSLLFIQEQYNFKVENSVFDSELKITKTIILGILVNRQVGNSCRNFNNLN